RSRASLDLPSLPTRRSSDLADAIGSVTHLDKRNTQTWNGQHKAGAPVAQVRVRARRSPTGHPVAMQQVDLLVERKLLQHHVGALDRKSTRLNSSHVSISYAV